MEHRTIHHARTVGTVAIGLLLALAALEAKSEGPGETTVGVIPPVGPISPPNHVRDMNGNAPTSDDTLLWRFCAPATIQCPDGGKVPVMTPDGSRQVTWGEWRAVEGWLRTKCVEEGSHVTLHVRNALPGAVYTAWMAFPDVPGPATAAGDPEGTDNVFRTSARGEGALSFIRPGTGFPEGKSPACLYSSESRVHLILDYHMDSQSHGPGPGDPSTQAFHSVAVIK